MGLSTKMDSPKAITQNDQGNFRLDYLASKWLQAKLPL
jgi:hypothetical protein